MSAVLWIVGEPGAGKTTLVRELLGAELRLVKSPKWTVGRGGTVAAGHYIGAVFDGADTVPYNGAAAALVFWREMLASKAALTILDGDRFSSANSLHFFRELPSKPRLLCARLTLTAEEAALRRVGRGSAQNEAWVRGRATKARRFFEGFPETDRLELDAAIDTGTLAARVVEWLTGS